MYITMNNKMRFPRNAFGFQKRDKLFELWLINILQILDLQWNEKLFE